MTIEELYQWAKENDCEKVPLVVPVPLTSEYEEKLLEAEDIMLSKDSLGDGMNKTWFGVDQVIRLG